MNSNDNGKKVVLSKAVCKKCYIDNYHNPKDAVWKYHNSMGAWPSVEEAWDEEDRAICPEKFNVGRGVSIYDPPPSWCPHKFRHAVAAGMSEKQCQKEL